MDKINEYDKIKIENQKRKKNMQIKEITVLHKSPSNRWFRNRIHNLLSRADARGGADIIYRI